MNDLTQVLDALRKPFHPSHIIWKPGAVKGDRALALAFADLRAYMNRLDEVCGSDWSVAYEPWGADRIICKLTILGITRSSTGETTNESEKSEIGGTVAEAQAFKRACAMFGLGRYLYTLPTGWADFDPATKRFTEKAKARLTGIVVQHYRRATADKGTGELADMFAGEDDTDHDNHDTNHDTNHDDFVAASGAEAGGSRNEHNDTLPSELFDQFNALGQDLYGDQWAQVSRRNAKRISNGKTQEGGELTPEQIQKLIDGMTLLKSKRVDMSSPAANGAVGK